MINKPDLGGLTIFGAQTIDLGYGDTDAFHIQIPGLKKPSGPQMIDADSFKKAILDADNFKILDAVDAKILEAEPNKIVSRKVKPSIVKDNLDDVLANLEQVFSSAMNATIGNLRLDEIEVGLEIGTDGSVGIFGIGMKVTGKSSITVKFKRSDKAAQKTDS